MSFADCPSTGAWAGWGQLLLVQDWLQQWGSSWQMRKDITQWRQFPKLRGDKFSVSGLDTFAGILLLLLLRAYFFSKLNLLALWLSLPREEQCCQLLPFASQMAIPFALWCKLDQIQIFITYLNYLPHLPAHTKYRINRSESSSLVFLSNSFVVD